MAYSVMKFTSSASVAKAQLKKLFIKSTSQHPAKIDKNAELNVLLSFCHTKCVLHHRVLEVKLFSFTVFILGEKKQVHGRINWG